MGTDRKEDMKFVSLNDDVTERSSQSTFKKKNRGVTTALGGNFALSKFLLENTRSAVEVRKKSHQSQMLSAVSVKNQHLTSVDELDPDDFEMHQT